MIDITFNNLTKADGSAIIDQDDTIVQATVFGPVDIVQSRINYEEAVVEILYKPKINIHSSSPAFDQIRELENVLKLVFKEVILTRLHPRTCISILVQEIHDRGSLLSCTINGVCCALIDAGVPMKCPVAGVSIKMEESCKIDFVFDANLDLITVLTRGCIEEKDLKKAIELGKEEAKITFNTMREKVKKRFTC